MPDYTKITILISHSILPADVLSNLEQEWSVQEINVPFEGDKTFILDPGE